MARASKDRAENLDDASYLLAASEKAIAIRRDEGSPPIEVTNEMTSAEIKDAKDTVYEAYMTQADKAPDEIYAYEIRACQNTPQRER
ncbi:MAG: hypothetical protein WBY93_20975 [Candidatus Binatus sp.]